METTTSDVKENKFVFPDEELDVSRYNEMLKHAESIGDETLENCIDHLRRFFRNSGGAVIVFRRDRADLSLNWYAYRPEDTERRQCFYNGGLIYFASSRDWSIHS